jgi:hypothetical protein
MEESMDTTDTVHTVPDPPETRQDEIRLVMHYEVKEMKEFILWARESGIALGEVHVGSVRASLTDPQVNIPTRPGPGPNDDAENRGVEPPVRDYYSQYAARSRTPGKKT